VILPAILVQGAGDFQRNEITENWVFVKPHWDISHSVSVVFMFGAVWSEHKSLWGPFRPHCRAPTWRATYSPAIHISDNPSPTLCTRRTVDHDQKQIILDCPQFCAAGDHALCSNSTLRCSLARTGYRRQNSGLSYRLQVQTSSATNRSYYLGSSGSLLDCETVETKTWLLT
jgi:hypothetical protein